MLLLLLLLGEFLVERLHLLEILPDNLPGGDAHSLDRGVVIRRGGVVEVTGFGGGVFLAENGGESGEGEVLEGFLDVILLGDGGRRRVGVVEAFEVVVLIGYGAGARGVAVGEEGEVAGEGGAAAGGVTCGGGGGGGAGGGEEESANHGDALGEVKRQKLALVEELISGAQSRGGFAWRD